MSVQKNITLAHIERYLTFDPSVGKFYKKYPYPKDITERDGSIKLSTSSGTKQRLLYVADVGTVHVLWLAWFWIHKQKPPIDHLVVPKNNDWTDGRKDNLVLVPKNQRGRLHELESTLSLPKLLIIGYARCGKDTVGDLLAEHGFEYLASSSFATSRIMMSYFKSVGIDYPSDEACFDDRVSNRTVWYEQIQAYNAPTWNRMSREMLSEGYQVYGGMRSLTELTASRELYDAIVWIDASYRVPPEDISSCTVSKSDADIILDNNGTLDELNDVVHRLVELVTDPDEREHILRHRRLRIQMTILGNPRDMPDVESL